MRPLCVNIESRFLAVDQNLDAIVLSDDFQDEPVVGRRQLIIDAADDFVAGVQSTGFGIAVQKADCRFVACGKPRVFRWSYRPKRRADVKATIAGEASTRTSART